ncbi:MAG: hypothetical protein IJR67_04960 [Acholeplasmatales bacterium]|nr:hypothetical protein [Acholeplasmatales bacterium]
MQPIEIITIIFVVVVLGLIFGVGIYKRIKHIPSDDCACKHKRKSKEMFSNIKKELDKEI